MLRSALTSLTLALLTLVACATPAPAGHQPGEEEAVLAVFDAFLRTLETRDLEAMAALQTADGMTYQIRANGEAEMSVGSRPNAEWLDPTRYGDAAYRERYWSPTVLVRGGMAVVWAPYEFWADGQTSHCGIDLFQFVKVDGRWLVANSAWTTEPRACEELRPDDPGGMRPAD